MERLHPAIEELVHDPQGDKSKQQLMALVRGLESEGVPKRAIGRGLAGALLDVSCELVETDGAFFIRQVGDVFTHLADEISDRAGAIQRNREAGGTGMAWQ